MCTLVAVLFKLRNKDRKKGEKTNANKKEYQQRRLATAPKLIKCEPICDHKENYLQHLTCRTKCVIGS